MGNEVDVTMIDRAINATLQAIDEGKQQIFAIAESARLERQLLLEELEAIQTQVHKIVKEVDQLESSYRLARFRLAEISRNFGLHPEEKIKEVYEEAHRLQVAVMVSRERETQLRLRRDELQRRLKNLEEMIKRAEGLVSQLGVAYSYLSGDLKKIGSYIQTAEDKRLLGVQVIQAQEEERRRVAREIHDGPAQMMANVALRAEICEKMLDRDMNFVRRELRELKETVRDSLIEVRKIIFDLRPMTLDDLGLVPTLRHYVQHFQEKYGIEAQLKVFGPMRRFHGGLEIAVFRAVQEALMNVWKHAQASQVIVKVEIADTHVRVHIQDNGKGFDVKRVMENREHGRFGLLGMQERIQLLGGEIHFHSQPGNGTKIFISLPISE
ncbi:signal transduction histidine-protein kinase/phosphatase DegS [Collibacillus ludicampi]|uniref:Signal transduction histidine-protein kinase/phosphatase DegS n=1 Tax=Collibacillus ludicampi TaxID=2771369 RepID=A0AAV4LCV0_9BACL|nr:sensor histidine kinase [Collibacillus ludicampi]GIM45571.1 signal transduction histidine-protein kinase/phosphatase DegS [Collibacillus ludicampi]